MFSPHISNSIFASASVNYDVLCNMASGVRYTTVSIIKLHVSNTVVIQLPVIRVDICVSCTEKLKLRVRHYIDEASSPR